LSYKAISNRLLRQLQNEFRSQVPNDLNQRENSIHLNHAKIRII